jgi:hypothetical protein
MKAKMRTYLIFTVFIFLGSTMYIFPQGSNYRISQDTLIAGDTMILRINTWNYDPGKLKAAILPIRTYIPEDYPFYYNDTIMSFRTEVYSDTTYDFYFAVPMGTVPGLYDIAFLFDGNIVEWGLEVDVYTPPFLYQQPEDKIVCGDDTVIFRAMALGNDDGDLIYIWYHNGVKYNDYYKGNAIISEPDLQDTGSYYCVIANSFGKDTSYAARLDLFPVPAKQGPPMGPASFCPGIDSSVYSIHCDPLAIGYYWNLLPKTAGIVEQHDTSVIIRWNKDFSGIVKLFADLISEKCGSVSTEELEITVPGVSAPPVICIVGTDPESGKYQVVWEKSEIESPQLFRIYRESNMADVYVEIGSVYPDELSVFVDMSSAPSILSHRYKISYIDSCGNESELSNYHQTLHLAANLGINYTVNLAWSEYMGIPFPTYNLYRGAHPDSMNLLIQIPSTVTLFTDDNPPLGNIYYQVGMSNPYGCNPLKKAGMDYSVSISNMVQVFISGIGGTNENQSFSVYPNPVAGQLHMNSIKLLSGQIQYVIFNSLGINVLEGIIASESSNIDVNSLPPGLYIIKISVNKESYSTKFFIE